jgi:hypothetical protein
MELPPELSSNLLALIRAKGRQPAPIELLQNALLLSDYTLLPARTGGSLGGACPEGGRLASIQLPRARAKGSKCMPQCERGGVGWATLGIEIKPKCGFLPVAATIHPVNSIKRQKTRFALHQQLKFEQVYSRSPCQLECVACAAATYAPIPERCPTEIENCILYCTVHL